jgi:3-isopropylmalate/(R)-2-methylmalate dehydratase small subunit
MQPFTTLTAIAAPFAENNIDTDVIIPKQFLRTITRAGLGKSLFFDRRYNPDGSDKTDFVLNREPYTRAQILVTGENFGCGSSREHAPWALLDFGIRCVIAPSFADIFYNNCFKNGILPIRLPQAQVDALLADLQKDELWNLTVDLQNQTINASNRPPIPFNIDPLRKELLLGGLDDIGVTMRHAKEIDTYEDNARVQRPWLFT